MGICVSLMGYSSISKLLQIQGMAHVIPSIKTGTVVSFFLSGMMLLFLVDRIGTKRFGAIAFNLACLLPCLIVIAVIHHAAGLIMIIYPVYMLLIDVAGGCLNSLLSATLTDDKAQKGESSNAIVWSVASFSGLVLSFLLIQLMESWSGFLWVWAGFTSGLNMLILCAFRKIPEVDKPKKHIQHKTAKTHQAVVDQVLHVLVLIGRYTSCIGYMLVWFMILSYGVLFIDKPIIAGFVPLILFVVFPFGKWLTAEKLSKYWSNKTTIRIGTIILTFGLGVAAINPYQPLCMISSVAIAGTGCGINYNALWALVKQSTHYYGAQDGASRAANALANLIVSLLAVITGADDRMFWLLGIPFVLMSLVTLPFVKFPPARLLEKTNRTEG
jgi:MFS family permease